MKKAISVILSLVLALSCLIAITPFSAMAEDAVVEDATTEAATTNLMVNGGFEDGMIGWETDPGNSGSPVNAEPTTDEKNSGERSLKRWLDAKLYNQVVYQKITLKPNRIYNLSYYMKGSSDYLRTYVSYNTEKPTDFDHYVFWDGTVTSNNKDNWEKCSFTFKTNENTEYLIGIYHFMAGTAYFDDFCLEEVPAHSEKPIPDTGAVVNGTFEDGLKGWTEYKADSTYKMPMSLSSNDGYTGYASLYVNSYVRHDNRALGQEITLEPNTKYKVSFYAKGYLGYGALRIKSDLTANPWHATATDLLNENVTGWLTANPSVWTKFTYYFDTNDSTKYLLSLTFSSNAGADVYIDDISIAKRESNSIIQNPGFEDGMIGWQTNASSMKAEATMTDSNSGEMSLHRWLDVLTYNQSIYQKINLKAETKYKLSFYVKDNPASGRMRVSNVNDKFFDGTGQICEKQLTSTYDEWTKITVYFTTNDATEYILSWTMASPGNAYFDDFELVEYDSILNNAGFEDGMDEWVTTNSPEVEVDNYEKYSGNNSLYFDLTITDSSRYNRTVSQNIKLKPYTEYTIKIQH